MTANAVTPDLHRRPLFATTRWSLVLASADADGPAEKSADALAELCRTYWRPVFAFICSRGHNPTDAQDLTQSFFLKILDGSLLQRADPQRGRFRALLLRALKNFLIDGHDRETAKKRGGGMEVLSWDELIAGSQAEVGAAPHALHGCAADRVFDIRWAATVVEQAQWRLGEECERRNRRRLFDAVREHLTGGASDISYAALAGDLGLAEDVLKRLLYRLRLRYRELLREQVAQTVGTPDEIDDEVRYLCSALAVETER